MKLTFTLIDCLYILIFLYLSFVLQFLLKCQAGILWKEKYRLNYEHAVFLGILQ